MSQETTIILFKENTIRRVWHKNVPEKSKANLRDYMTDLELIFTMLGEKITTEISQQETPDGLIENKKVARRGGKVAGNARKETEKEIGRSIISKSNQLEFSEKKRIKNLSQV